MVDRQTDRYIDDKEKERPYNARAKKRKFKRWKVNAMGHQGTKFLGHQGEVVV